MPTKITSEKGVKREVKKLLEKHDWFWWMPPANGFGKAGVSDFNAVKNGVFLAIETKFAKNKPTPAQKAFIESIWSQQGMGFAVNETHLEWLDQWLTDFDASTQAVIDAKGGDPAKAIDADVGARMLNAVNAMTELLK